jgi:hypothetical protein
MLELAAYRAGVGMPQAEEHLAACARCRAILASLPDVEEPASIEPQRVLPRLRERPVQLPPAELKTGQLWTASVDGHPGWHEVVAVLAPQTRVGEKELVLIAPVHLALDEAADTDLIVYDSPLGYPHLVSVWAQGTLLREQLCQYLGRLAMPEREALVDIYRGLFGQADRTTEAPTGGPLAGPEDPRVSARALRVEELRPLFAPADRLLGEEPDDEPDVVTFGRILAGVVTSDEWDRQTLLVAAGVDGASLDRLLNDQLDLTDQTDLSDVRRVLNVIHMDDWRGPIRASLEQSRGGERRATDAEPAIAARSFAGVSDAERERDLMGDQTAIDDSPAARIRAVESYVQALEKQIYDT